MLTPPLDGERQRPSHEPGQNATVNIMNEEKLRHFLYSLAWGILMRETSYSEDREEQRAADVFEELGLAVHVYNTQLAGFTGLANRTAVAWANSTSGSRCNAS